MGNHHLSFLCLPFPPYATFLSLPAYDISPSIFTHPSLLILLYSHNLNLSPYLSLPIFPYLSFYGPTADLIFLHFLLPCLCCSILSCSASGVVMHIHSFLFLTAYLSLPRL